MTEAGLRIALHMTARITFAFFVCAVTGNALRDLWSENIARIAKIACLVLALYSFLSFVVKTAKS
jgi:hypothetical protein